jgi:hypothetical protein
MTTRLLWTEPEISSVATEYRRLQQAEPALKKYELANRAQLVLLEGRRRPEGQALSTFIRKVVDGESPRKSRGVYKKRTAPEQITATPPQTVSGCVTIGDAVELLCEVIVAQVRTTIGPKIESTVASGIVEAARKVAPKPERPVDPKNLRALDTLQLRFELIKAKGEGDTIRAGKITSEFSRRESSASAIARESTDE